MIYLHIPIKTGYFGKQRIIIIQFRTKSASTSRLGLFAKINTEYTHIQKPDMPATKIQNQTRLSSILEKLFYSEKLLL